MLKLCKIVALSLMVASYSTGAVAGSTYKDFVQAWSERDARYVSQHDALDKTAREATSAFMQTAATTGADINPPLKRMVDSVDAASYVDGRGHALRDLRIFMEHKPALARTELWMQEHVDLLRRDQADATAKFASVDALKANPSTKPLDYLQSVVTAIGAAANLRGEVDELKLIDENLSSYFQAEGQEKAEARLARARIFGAMAGALRAYSSVPPPPALGWSATCDTFGSTTTCRGH